MEHFVLVPASKFKSKIKTTVVTKPKLSNYHVEKSPKYNVESLKKEINQKFSAKADALINKLLSSPRMKLSDSNTLLLGGKEFLSTEFARKLRKKNAELTEI